MAILSSNIKHLKSESMLDVPNGGGRMTSAEVPDGVAGSVFKKISRLDTVYGKINLLKIYAAVRSTLAEVYGGAHTIITDPPNNPRVGVVMFSTGSHFDQRTAAQDYVESYVVVGPLSRMRLYGNQAAGKALLVYQRVEEPLPDVGDVVCLSVEAAGYTPVQQYVAISEVDHEVRTFTDSQGDFERRVISLKLSSSLKQVFLGVEPSRYSGDSSPTKVRETQSSVNSHYYGIRTLPDALAIGDLGAKADSIYSPLVPSTQRETPVSLAQPIGVDGWVATGQPISVAAAAASYGDTVTFYMPTAVLPGSWRLNSDLNIKDDGTGLITGDRGTTGTIDYEAGRLTVTFFPLNTGYYGGFGATYTPAIRAQSRAHSLGLPVTLATRGYVYTHTCTPLPARGSAVIEYRALGKWYRLRDNGQGVLVGNSPGEGSGTVSYASGALVVTLGALPDIDSQVIVSWGSPAHYDQRAGATAANSSKWLEARFQLVNLPVKEGSISIALRQTPTSSVYTYTDSGGVLSGSGLRPGSINYTTGEIILPMPFSGGGYRAGLGTQAEIAYQQEIPTGGGPLVTTTTVSVSAPGSWNCGATNIAPGSVKITAPFDLGPVYGGGEQRISSVTLIDNRAGSLIALAGSVGSNFTDRRWWAAGQAVGTINYTTGDVTITTLTVQKYTWLNGSGVWQSSSFTCVPTVGDFGVTTKSGAATYSAKTESRSMSEIGYSYDVTATTGEPAVPGTIILKFGALQAYDRAGYLYYDINSATGAGTQCGTINYATGIAKFTALPDGMSLDEAGTPVVACLTTHGEFSAVAAAFRTAGSPIRPGSLYVQATAIDGVTCNGTADVNGIITGAHIRGKVDAVSGVVAVEFGDLVTGVWTPRDVWPATLRYSCVVITNLALEASILGVDPVRLPSDGRVQVIRPADVAVIHQTSSLTLPNPAVAGATIDSGRDSRTVTDPYSGDTVVIPAATQLELRDAAGQRIPDALYTIDMEAGTVTLADPLDLTGYTQPLVLRHGVEDMVLIDDVQITGEVSFSSTPLKYAYPDGAYISTAMLAGDIGARVDNLFDQGAWTNVWSSSVIGSEATAQFNDLQYPIIVSNDGAIKERWRAQVTSTSPLTVAIYGESLGLVGTYNATGTIAPINPLTSTAYFTISPGAWGAGGWSVGNNVRWDTEAACYPIWLARTILGGAALTGDSFDLATRGDVD